MNSGASSAGGPSARARSRSQRTIARAAAPPRTTRRWRSPLPWRTSSVRSCAVARRQEVAALQARELLAAQAGVTEHPDDRQIARAGQRVVGDPRLGLAQQPLVLRGGERLRCLALGALRARQPDRERLADLRGR